MHARLGDSTRRPAAHGRPLSRTIDTNASALKMLLSRLRGRHFVGDALSIYVLQALNYGVPLLTLPYLLRVLGPQAYGSIALAQAVMGFALILTDYGFNLTAVRDISIARNNPLLVARVYWFTMATKVFLMACSVPALAALVLLVPQLRNEWPVFAACWTMVLGNVLFPQWYFQGVQRLREAVVMQVIARCAVTAAIFILVRSPADAVGAALLMSVAQVAAFLVAIAAGRVPSPKTFRRPSVTEVSGSLAASWHLIAGTMATTLYIQANPFVLGLLCGLAAACHRRGILDHRDLREGGGVAARRACLCRRRVRRPHHGRGAVLDGFGDDFGVHRHDQRASDPAADAHLHCGRPPERRLVAVSRAPRCSGGRGGGPRRRRNPRADRHGGGALAATPESDGGVRPGLSRARHCARG